MTETDDVLLDGFRTLTALIGAVRPDLSPTPSGRSAPDGGHEEGGEPAAERCPVTVLTGVLGSGKTTVLRRLLQGDHGLSITAIVNDLGSINIDARLLDETATSGAGARLELTNGCACCSAGDDLRAALSAARQAEPAPDAVVIEASGAADAVAVAATVEGTTGVGLDGIVCVVDVDAAPDQLGHPVLGPLLRRQLAAAHLVALSKIDLVDPAALDEVRAVIAELAPGRQLLPISDGHLEPAVLLGAALRGASLRPEPRPHQLDLVTATVVLGPERRFDPAPLAAWFEDNEHGLIRAKGWLAMTDGSRRQLQVVGRRWTLGPAEPADGSGSELVLIADRPNTLAAAKAVLHRLSD